MQTITIHKAGAADAACIAQMACQLAAFEGEGSHANASGIAQMLSGNGPAACEALIARCENEPIGFALFYAGYDVASDSCGYHLADMFVQEGWRKKGAGKQLIAAISRQAKQQDLQWISLTALARNKQANGFYKALGFTRAEVDFFAIGAKALQKLR